MGLRSHQRCAIEHWLSHLRLHHWKHPQSSRHRTSTDTPSHRILGIIPQGALGRDGFDRFHDRGSLDQGRPENVLFALCHGAKNASRQLRGLHHQSERSVDENDRPRTDQSRGRFSQGQAVLDHGLRCDVQ